MTNFCIPPPVKNRSLGFAEYFRSIAKQIGITDIIFEELPMARLLLYLKIGKSDAALIMEIGYAQGQVIKELLERAGIFAEVKIEKDFHDNDRVVTAKKVSK